MEEGNPHFLDTHRATLIQTINDVATTLDILLEKTWLTSEQYDRIMVEKTSQNKMRTLIGCTRGWDDHSKDQLCLLLRRENKNVSIFDRWRPMKRDTAPEILEVEHCGSSTATACSKRPAGDKAYKYGDVLEVECSGASNATVQRNSLGKTGVAASYSMAERDKGAIQALKSRIIRVGKRRGIDPALIAGLISRSSNAGALLNNGYGYDKNSFGLMQVSSQWHKIRGEWDSEEHIDQGTEILAQMIEYIKNRFPDWPPTWHLKGGVAAYMCGPSNVESYNKIDERTDCKDFSNDVIGRAHWYKRNVLS